MSNPSTPFADWLDQTFPFLRGLVHWLDRQLRRWPWLYR